MSEYSSFDGHGVDVAVNRADDLDKRALAYIADHPGCRVLELGSGAGGQSLRMAQAGAEVTAVDQFDFSKEFAAYQQSNLRFVPGDMVDVHKLLVEQSFHLAVCQRTIHYLNYNQAKDVLTTVRSLVGDALYISVTGSGSLVGDVYPHQALPIHERFGKLSELGQEMFSITESVCLYSESEFRQLLEESGWRVDECWVSAFGNIKAICSNVTS